MKPHRILGATFVVLALSLVASASAFANTNQFSTTLYQPGDTITQSNVANEIHTAIGSPNCTIIGGTFQIPSSPNNHDSGGDVTANFTTPPLWRNCVDFEGQTWYEASVGTWTISAQYGDATTKITAPTDGFRLQSPGGACYENRTPLVFSGGWNNGFSFPSSQLTSITWQGNATLTGGLAYDCAGTTDTLNITTDTALQTLTDTTTPGEVLPVIGP